MKRHFERSCIEQCTSFSALNGWALHCEVREQWTKIFDSQILTEEGAIHCPGLLTPKDVPDNHPGANGDAEQLCRAIAVQPHIQHVLSKFDGITAVLEARVQPPPELNRHISHADAHGTAGDEQA
ncbi:MAG TPA: hypothetical protein VK978_03565 [Candidatus Saccharimonadales bacterium]|nr:hypothetical protein [Candidatus Saccharimonadales bacterium]